MGERSLIATRAAVAAVALSLGPGCFYSADKGRALELRVERLQADNKSLVDALEGQKKEALAQVPKIEAKIKEVETALALLDKASRRSSADVGVQAEKLIQDVQDLRGQVEQYLHKIAELDKALAEVRDAHAKRLVEAEKGLNEFKSSEVGKELRAKAKLEAIQRPSKKDDFLELAKKHLADDKAIGRALIAEFLKKWGADALAAHARFALGQSFQEENRCRDALEEYGTIVKQFSKSPVAADALLRSSPCFAELKMPEEAKAALEETVKSYPKTEAAKLAQKRLDEMKKEKKPSKKK